MRSSVRLPMLAAWSRRPTDPLAQGAFLLVAGLSLTGWLAAMGPPGTPSVAALATSFAQLVLVIGGAALLLRRATRRRVSTAAGLTLSSTAVAVWLGLDRLHAAVFGAHLDSERFELLGEALRSGAVKVDVGLLAALIGAVLAVALALRALLVLLSYLPRREGLSLGVGRSRGPVAAALILLTIVDPGAPSGRILREPLPWARPESSPVLAQPSASGSPLDGVEERAFARWDRERAALLAAPLSARRRPNVVIVHAESVRSDMLRADVMPNTLRLSQECLSPRHHYSTSNATGGGMFGLLTGLPVSYYALARRRGDKPLPLQILKKLGYSLSAYYSGYLSTYDGLCDLFFKDVVDRIDEERDPRADLADKALVDRYVAALAKRDPSMPTFDYLVLESSHYDYAYPPEFERFTPTATLGVGIRDGILRRAGINDELKPRAQFIRNRYQNSILWTDSLIQRIAVAWAARGEDVVLVVTGDHGEAFWERGVFGHGTSMSDEQVRVPLVMCMPGRPTTKYEYSSHADIFATIFDFMGLDAPRVPLLAGKSLLRYEASRDIAVLGYGVTGSQVDDRLAVAGDGLKVVFVNRAPFPTVSAVLDGDRELVLPAPADIAERIVELKALAIEARMVR